MEIFKLFGSIFVDTDKADESIKKTDKNVNNLAKDFMNGVTTAVKWATGIATAIGSAAVAVTETTREYRNEMAKLETAYESANFSAESAKKVYEALNAVLGDTGQAVEASNHLAKLCNTEEELSTWTDICTGVYATFGDSLPIEGLTEAANETAKTGTLTGSLADALNWAGVNEDEFQTQLDACSTEQERQALITSTLNDLYAEAAEAYKTNNKEVLDANSAQEKLNAAMASVGEVLEPLITNVKLFAASLLEKVIPQVTAFTEGNDELKTILGFVAVAIGIVTSAATAYNVVQGVKAVMDKAEVTTLGALIKVKLASAAATAAAVAPYLLVTAAIAAVIAIGVTLYKNWDKIKEKCIELASKVKEKFVQIKESISNKIEEAKQAAVEKFNTLKSKAIEEVNTLKDKAVEKFNTLKSKAVEKVNDLKNKAIEKFNGLKDACSNVIEKVKSTISKGLNSAKDTVSNVLSSIKDKFTSIFDKVKTTVSNAINKVKDIFDFKWSLPKLETPHFSVSGGEAPWGFGGKGELPSVDVEWYAKAMNEPMLLTEPTIFGYNSATGKFQGGGEAGSEVVSGTNTLMNMISTAVSGQNTEFIAVLYKILEAIIALDENMGGNLREALAGTSFEFNRREFARLVKAVN